MDKHTKVTVILTSFNHAKYLRESIESVLHQTYSDYELIIGDDASTDDSWQIINGYTDPRIRSFRHDKTKGGGIINKVVSEMGTGNYIAIHHSDDIWEPEKLEKQVAFLDANPQIAAVFTWAQAIDEEGQPFKDQTHFYYNIFDQPNRNRFEWLNFFFYHGNALCHPSVLIRKECYDECGLYRYGLAQAGDFDMWVRVCLKYEIHVLPEKLVSFRVRAQELNASGNRPEVSVRGQFEFLQVLDNYRKLSNFEDLKRIFPTAEKYARPDGVDLGFVLGMVALETKSYKFTELFGLSLLFEALNDSGRANRIHELYGFTHSDFIVLTGKHDIFSKLWIEELTTRVTETDARLAETTTKLNETEISLAETDAKLHSIYNSNAWKVSLVISRIAHFFIRPKR
jgi:glycosyltransferase involved in cell wall biosynthesis